MSTDIERQKTFEERMMDRIKESVADLITDDELKKIIEKGVEKAFFEPRTGTDRWGNRSANEPSLVEQMVKKELEGRMEKAVQNWIAEHPDKLEYVMKSVMEQGVAGCVEKAMEARFGYLFGRMIEQMKNEGVIR